MIDQYHIPNMPQQEPQPLSGEVFSVTPEITEPPYSFVKPIEQQIDALRSGADESVLIRNRISRIFRPVLKQIVKPASGASLERQLVDCESELGGALFPQLPGILSQRFWYHQHDWFFEQTDQVGSMTARYHVKPNEITKLVNGRFAELQEAERQHLLQSIPRYHATISNEMYTGRAVPVVLPEPVSEQRRSDFDLAA